ncbi:MAG: ThuA domain-containing protein [Flavobacteriales bacterium]|nr:ThuA domain-containing protein [Flavobacteriales bacterium]
MRYSSTLLASIITLIVGAQPRILHFTRTSGFDHQTRGVSLAMFQSIASELGLLVDDDATSAPFSDSSTLAQYSVIVFSNTSGNAILNAQQQANFEAWVANGGRVMGIHAASDTYRHSTANGGNTGAWDFYAELIGASVQENPNHVSGTPQYSMQHMVTHASTANLPDPWVKNEEYYYWEGGYYGPNNVEVLRVEGTVGPNGQMNSYDAPRPMSWYRIEPNGSRVFYTALGHDQSNYTSDVLYRTHIRDALAWLLDGSTNLLIPSTKPEIHVFPNPATDMLIIDTDDTWTGSSVHLMDATGRTVLQATISGQRTTVPLNGLAHGTYMLRTKDFVLLVQIIR